MYLLRMVARSLTGTEIRHSHTHPNTASSASVQLKARAPPPGSSAAALERYCGRASIRSSASIVMMLFPRMTCSGSKQYDANCQALTSHESGRT